MDFSTHDKLNYMSEILSRQLDIPQILYINLIESRLTFTVYYKHLHKTSFPFYTFAMGAGYKNDIVNTVA